jgi:hypothetical protein
MAADLSKLSTEDLLALKSGDLSKVSTQGLMTLKGQVAPEKQTLHTEDTIYDPVTGVPLSSPTYGPETTGGTNVARKVLTGAAALPVSVATGVARGSGAVGIPQLVSKLLGSNVGDEGVKALGQIEKGMEQQGGEYLQKGANIAGQVAPWVMSGMKGSPLSTDITSKVMGLSEKIPALPSYAQKVIGGTAVGGLAGAVAPEAPTANLADYLREKSIGTGVSAATGGAIPAVVEPGAKLVGSLLKKGLGISTGAGEQAIGEAYKAGKTGNKTFLENIKGDVPVSDVLDIANKDLNKIGQDLSSKYRSGMVDISKDKAVLDFGNINQAIADAKNIVTYKGQTVNKSAAQKVAEAQKEVSKWQSLDPNEFHTPEGMDKLKQKIGSILEDIPYEQRTARKAVQDIYGSIRSEIANQAPTYNKVMRDYHEGMELVNDIKKTLSLGEGKNAETGIKKLQSIMRNNANTSWGNRLEVAKKLEEQGGGELMPALAGQALNAWTPRGIVGQGADIGAALMAFNNPSALAAIPLTSPRAMGMTAYGFGKVAPGETGKNLAKLLTIQGINRMNQGE